MEKLDESWIDQKEDKLRELFFDLYEDYIDQLPHYQRRKEYLSGLNRLNRSSLWSCDELNLEVKPGDICYMDFGQVYINEAGYQHFGLVISNFNYKLFVVPMTSNRETIRRARELCSEHLFYIGQLEGLNKPSVLFLNDCKFINSSRVISINSYLCPNSAMFKEIENELKMKIFNEV